MKKKILFIMFCILAIVGCFVKMYYPDSDFNNTISVVQNIVEQEINKEIIVSEFAESESIDTIQATVEGEDISTVEILESSFEEENTLENQLENDAKFEQENISYNGDSIVNGLSLLGAYQGLTYYSQGDSRWANLMYSSVGNKNQTMKSSACRTNFCSNGCFKLKRCGIANSNGGIICIKWIQNC